MSLVLRNLPPHLAASVPYRLTASRKQTARGVGIQHWYGAMPAREFLLRKVNLQAALGMFVGTEEEELDEDEEELVSQLYPSWTRRRQLPKHILW